MSAGILLNTTAIGILLDYYLIPWQYYLNTTAIGILLNTTVIGKPLNTTAIGILFEYYGDWNTTHGVWIGVWNWFR